jgi:membrane-bound lytic murein transglycosylase B
VSADDVTAQADAVRSLVQQARAESAHLSARARRLARAEVAAAAASAARAEHSAAGRVGAMGIPSTYLRLYQAAAKTCPGLPWTLLAAVGQVESGHGRNNGPSSAGAIGPMQFRPATFAAYAVDGNHDGHLDPWSPADSIFTAAHFLCANGAGSTSGQQRALLHYNNAQWYVDLVLAVQQRIAAAY